MSAASRCYLEVYVSVANGERSVNFQLQCWVSTHWDHKWLFGLFWFVLVSAEMEPGPLFMLRTRSNTELHLQPDSFQCIWYLFQIANPIQISPLEFP